MRDCDCSSVSNFTYAYQTLRPKWNNLYLLGAKRRISLVFEKWTKVKIRGEHKWQRLPETTWRDLHEIEAWPLFRMYFRDNNRRNARLHGFWLDSDTIWSAFWVARSRHKNDRVYRQVVNNRILPTHQFPLQENTYRVHRVHSESRAPLYQRSSDHSSKAVRTRTNRRGS